MKYSFHLLLVTYVHLALTIYFESKNPKQLLSESEEIGIALARGPFTSSDIAIDEREVNEAEK